MVDDEMTVVRCDIPPFKSGMPYRIAIEGDADFTHDVELMRRRKTHILERSKKSAECGIAGQMAFQAHLNQSRVYYLADAPELILRSHTLKNNVDFDILGVGLVDVKTQRCHHRKFLLHTDKIKPAEEMADYFVVLREENDWPQPIEKVERLLNKPPDWRAYNVKKVRVFEVVGWLLGTEIKKFPTKQWEYGECHERSLCDIRKKRPYGAFYTSQEETSFDFYRLLIESKNHHAESERYKKDMHSRLAEYARENPF